MKKFVLPIALVIFLFVISSSSVYAQSSDCKQKYKDWVSTCEKDVTVCNECQGSNKNPVCDKACNDSVDKCIQAQDTLDACLGVDRKTWMLEPQTPGHLTCDEWKKLSMLGAAQNCTDLAWKSDTGGVWCSASIDEGIRRASEVPPDYIFDFDYNLCTSSATADDVRLFNTGSSSKSGSSPALSQQKTNKTVPASGNNSGEKGNPFNIFGINPYQTWLNLVELAKAGVLMKSGAFDRFTESTILHSVGTEPYWERDARAKGAYDNFYNQTTERFVKLQGKTGLTEINDSTKKTMIEAAKDSKTLKKDSAVIEIKPHVGEKGILETGDKPMLKSGAVDVIVEPQNGKSFEMQTPNTEIMVIGTEFSVIYDQKQNETMVAVYKGKVEVKTNDGKVTTIVPDGRKPGVVIVAQKLSIARLVLVGLALVAVAGVAIFFLKGKFPPKRAGKRK